MYSKHLLRIAPVIPIALSSTAMAMCDEPTTADRIRGNYENKIRFFANPEKIFETFANVREEKGVFMSYKDFFHSLTPYSFHVPSEEKKDYFEEHTPQIMTLVDVNNDKKIDFNEYIFFITILQLNEGEMIRTFEKVDPENKRMTKDQFEQALTTLRKATALGSKQQNRSMLPDGRKITTVETDLQECNKTLVEHLFADKEFVTIDDFTVLKRSLKEALLHYEFNQFEVDENGTISSEDFAKSLLSCFTFSQAYSYLSRIHSLKLEGRVSFNEYIAFHCLIEKADLIKIKIMTYRLLSKSMFRELCDDFSQMDAYLKQKGYTISDTQVDVFMQVLDDDQNGMLEYNEVIDVLEGKKNIGLGKDVEFKNDMIEKFNKYMKKFHKMVGW
jgi:Ca2+-binding EF-hand superfamily protein